MWDNPCFSLPFLFCGPPTSEESAPDGAEQAAPRGVVHIDVGAPAKRRGGIQGQSQFLGFGERFRCLLVCVSVPFVGVSPRENIHDADYELFRP